MSNISKFEAGNFNRWKRRFVVFLEGLEPCLIDILEQGPHIPMSSLSTPENPLPKRKNQWTLVEVRLVNQDKRLKSIMYDAHP